MSGAGGLEFRSMGSEIRVQGSGTVGIGSRVHVIACSSFGMAHRVVSSWCFGLSWNISALKPTPGTPEPEAHKHRSQTQDPSP